MKESKNQFMIRPYQSSDRKELIKIFKLNTPDYFDPLEVDEFKEYLKSNSSTHLVIEQNGLVVGGGGYQLKDDNTIGQITWIFFHPDNIGQGLGSKLMHEFFNIFKTHTELKTIQTNTSQHAYHFFRKFGFQLSKTQKDYWGKGFDLYLMEKSL